MTSTIQRLEPRRLLSASASFGNGLLTVTGTNRADNLEISVFFNSVTVRAEGQQIFAGAAERVVVRAGNGNDRITYNNDGPGVPERIPVYVTIFGDNGNDHIVASTFRAPGATVHGGNGDDFIRVDNFLPGNANRGAVIHGNNGNDVIETANGFGTPGATVFGGNGNDRITATSREHVDQGHVLYGENGDDILTVINIESTPGHRLYGGNGKDRLTGSSGDDFFDGGKGRDSMDGGGGFDTAVRDRDDLLASIERLV